MWVCFVGFIYEFDGTCAPFFGGVTIFGHKAEEEIDEVMHGFGLL